MRDGLSPEFVANLLCSPTENSVLLAIDEIARRMYDHDLKWIRTLSWMYKVPGIQQDLLLAIQIQSVWVMVDRFSSIYGGDASPT